LQEADHEQVQTAPRRRLNEMQRQRNDRNEKDQREWDALLLIVEERLLNTLTK
jgi:hypothetical protein